MNDSNEKILAVLPNISKKKGMFSLRRDYYTLILTEERMIFAKFTKELSKKQVNDIKQVIEENKKNKTGFLTSIADRMLAHTQWFKRYETMDISEIINESSENIVLNKSDIFSLKILEFMESNEDSYQENTQAPLLYLKAKNTKLKFMFSNGYNPRDIKILKYWVE